MRVGRNARYITSRVRCLILEIVIAVTLYEIGAYAGHRASLSELCCASTDSILIMDVKAVAEFEVSIHTWAFIHRYFEVSIHTWAFIHRYFKVSIHTWAFIHRYFEVSIHTCLHIHAYGLSWIVKLTRWKTAGPMQSIRSSNPRTCKVARSVASLCRHSQTI
eukprot:jgi/Botrbrau1/6832/Bobra.0153s0027.1